MPSLLIFDINQRDEFEVKLGQQQVLLVANQVGQGGTDVGLRSIVELNETIAVIHLVHGA